jgi:hypothetical protein
MLFFLSYFKFRFGGFLHVHFCYGSTFLYSSVLLRCLKQTRNVQAWWLTSVIPVTQEAEMRKISVQGQPSQKVSEILS